MASSEDLCLDFSAVARSQFLPVPICVGQCTLKPLHLVAEDAHNLACKDPGVAHNYAALFPGLRSCSPSFQSHVAGFHSDKSHPRFLYCIPLSQADSRHGPLSYEVDRNFSRMAEALRNASQFRRCRQSRRIGF